MSVFGLPDHTATVDNVEPIRYPHRQLHVILATTGSVASIKAPLIIEELLKYKNIALQVVATESSVHFFKLEEIEAKSSGLVKVWRDVDEWKDHTRVSDPILHIELRRWVDLIIVAPCSANTLAKIANGLSDNLLTSLLRAIDIRSTKVILFPAMNTHMYNHPLTAKHLSMVTDELKYEVIGPISKGLACGDLGIGAMTEWKDIVKMVVDRYHLQTTTS